MNIYCAHLKVGEFDKETPQIFRLERAAFVIDKGPSENGKYGVKPTPSKTQLSSGSSIFFSILLLLIMPLTLSSQEAWKVVVLGCSGGPKETNLSGYLLSPIHSNNYIALDAGSLLSGIYIANEKGSFKEIEVDPNSVWTLEGEILRNHIKAYFISHAHLDHVAGLVINSPIDTKKPIFGIDSTIDFIKNNLFNWQIWPNFASEGEKPCLNQYQYKRMNLKQKIPILNTDMTVEPFLLSHPGSYASTAFLIEASDSYVVYFGDTAPDSLETKKHIQTVWEKIAPLIQQNKLRGILLECSYANQTPPAELFGHLDSQYVLEELGRLAILVNPKNPQTALKNIKVIITHIKNSPLKGPSPREIIQQELETENNLGIQFIFAEQGEKIEF